MPRAPPKTKELARLRGASFREHHLAEAHFPRRTLVGIPMHRGNEEALTRYKNASKNSTYYSCSYPCPYAIMPLRKARERRVAEYALSGHYRWL